jgi:hypothetical protein
LELLAGDLLGAGHESLGAVEVHDEGAALVALGGAGDDLADALGELVEIELRSSSRNFWIMTCLKVWAAMRPKSAGEISSSSP